MEDGSYDYLPYIPPMQKQWIEILGYIQLVSSLTLLLGFCVNNRSLVIQEGWRLRCEQNAVELKADQKRLDRLAEDKEGPLKVTDLDIGDARLVLQLEGPKSDKFKLNSETDEYSFHYAAVSFEYYWISLSHIIKNGNFIFSVQYLAFSLQGSL